MRSISHLTRCIIFSLEIWLGRSFGTFVGILFPSCECGIVPIINRFLEKKVPSYTAVPFLVTAPVINPIVLFATYSAFGNSFHVALLRALGSIVVAVILGIFLGFFWQEPIQKENRLACHEHDFSHLSPAKKLFRSLCKQLMNFLIRGVIWYLAVSLPLLYRSMFRHGF